MAKRKKQTIVKNGKRVPASTKGKPEKKPKDTAAAERKAAKEKKAKQIAQAVWKATEAHKSTIGKLAALVDTFEEYDEKAETLRDEIGGLKGQIAEDKSEIRRIVKDEDDSETVDLRKLEKDIQRREVQLAGKQEERSGAREAMKCAMADMRKIIREGPGLFEDKPKEEEPTGAGKAPSPTSASSNGQKPKTPTEAGASKSAAPSATSSPKENGTPPPSTSQASHAKPAEPDPLAGITCMDVLVHDAADGKSLAKALSSHGIVTLRDAANKGKTFVIGTVGISGGLAQKLFDKIRAIRHAEPELAAAGA